MKVEGWKLTIDSWRMKDEGGGDVENFILAWVFLVMDGQTDICECRVAFATEKLPYLLN